MASYYLCPGMMSNEDMVKHHSRSLLLTLPMTVQGVELDIASISREGAGAGGLSSRFGSSKEDYADFVRHQAFEGQPFIAWDAPGCGESQCADYSKMGLPFLLETALKVISHAGFTQVSPGRAFNGRINVASAGARFSRASAKFCEY
jgi:hypothetical protein